MNNDNSIFRPEALHYKNNAWLGDFSISTPSVLKTSLWFALGVLLICILLLFTTYTQRVPVSGRVIYTPSAAEVIFNQDGVISRIEVLRGDMVKKGDIIATLSRDVAYVGGGINQSLLDAAQRQIVELQKREVDRHREIKGERQRLCEKISIKEKEITAIKAAIDFESGRSIRLNERMSSYLQLLQKGITTVQEKNERENEYHNSIAQLHRYRINITRVQGERIQLLDELAHSVAREKQAITDMRQQLVTLQQQVINASVGIESYIVAPIDGIVASLNILEGQRINTGTIAAVLVPENAKPYVEMWLPPSALPEVKTGQQVMMRVESLPWERFGKVPGSVADISASPEALTGSNRRFRLLIVPDTKIQVLPAGVEVHADILTTRRRIWAWIFLPINKIIKRIMTEN
ncbi:HlyD family secretion protein [Sodalis sp. C49]|uniref:HlyD family secretion protein n=1 Tax=Sodalis sp. C49 TaxID=3228929 RepID=UPI0039659C71